MLNKKAFILFGVLACPLWSHVVKHLHLQTYKWSQCYVNLGTASILIWRQVWSRFDQLCILVFHNIYVLFEFGCDELHVPVVDCRVTKGTMESIHVALIKGMRSLALVLEPDNMCVIHLRNWSLWRRHQSRWPVGAIESTLLMVTRPLSFPCDIWQHHFKIKSVNRINSFIEHTVVTFWPISPFYQAWYVCAEQLLL